MYPLLGTTGLGVLVYVSCLVGVVVLARQGQKAWQRANRVGVSEQIVAEQTQNYTAVRGTRVSLVKPQEFTEAENFSGFQHHDTGSAIVVTELPAAYGQIASGFNAENLKSSGMNLISQSSLTVNGYEARLLQVTQVAHLTTFMKWILVFGDETETVTIVASMPEKIEISAPLKNVLVNAKWRKDQIVNPFADLNFAITSTPSLTFAQRIQNNLLYTSKGVIPTKSPGEPLLVVGQAISDIELINRRQYSQQRLAQTVQIKNLLIDTTKEINISGLNGYEIIAIASDSETDLTLAIYQVMLFEQKTYYIIQGIVSYQLKAQYWSDFMIMASSFRKK